MKKNGMSFNLGYIGYCLDLTKIKQIKECCYE
jgi:hypothetical protein